MGIVWKSLHNVSDHFFNKEPRVQKKAIKVGLIIKMYTKMNPGLLSLTPK